MECISRLFAQFLKKTNLTTFDFYGNIIDTKRRLEMLKEFKEFISRGNIVDMAVGVIVGGAFQKIVNSLVNNVIMPYISIFTCKIDYTDWIIVIGNASIKIGSFLTTIINFLIIALSIFLAVRYANKLNKKLEKMKLEEIEK